jgi:glucoamylase
VWDAPDIPSAGMYLGRPAGSAMPLMWAHAEYVKLLRTIADRRVFDRLPIVAERYLNHRGRTDLEIWKPLRQAREVAPGQVLRVQAEAAFDLRWSADLWQTVNRSVATATGVGVHFVDMPVAQGQQAPLRFVLLWRANAGPDEPEHEVCVVRARG